MMRRKTWRALCVALLVLSTGWAWAAGPVEVTAVEGMTEYRLGNGARVLLFPDSSRPVVTVNMTVFVGSRHEGYGEAGMAHLLEHMMFKGTALVPNVDKAMGERGARFNASTWFDRTNYFETMPAGDENLEWGIRFEADRLVNAPVRAEDLASEMTVVRNEFESGENSPRNVLEERMLEAAYVWHNYGKPTIGNRSDIERVPADRLRRFYQRHYRPDNVLVILAGKFDRAKALAMAEKYFGAVARPGEAMEETYTEEPAQDGEREVTLRRVGDVGVVGMVFHVPAGSHEEFAAVDVLQSVLTDAPSGELYKALVETKKAAAVRGETAGLHDPGYVQFMADVREGQSMGEVRTIMGEVMKKVAERGVSDEQVEGVKKRFVAGRRREMVDTSRLAVALSEWAAQGDWRLFFLMRDRMEKVTAKDVQAAAKKYLRESNRTVGLYIPTKEAERTPVPAPPDVAEVLKGYKGREAVSAGEELDPDPVKIEARVQRPGEIEGVKVALLPKKSRQEMAVVRLNLRYGNEENLKGMRAAGEILPGLMLRGTKKLSRQQLRDALDELEATLSGGGGRGAAGDRVGEISLTLQAPRGNLEKALELMRQVVREPAFPTEEFEVMRRERLARLEASRTEPQVLAREALDRKLNPYPKGDVRYEPTVEETIEEVKGLRLKQVRELYEKYVASTGELAAVGDFETAELMAAMRGMLSGWKAQMPYARIERRPVEMSSGGPETVIVTPDKANAVYYGGIALAMKDSEPDYPAFALVGEILGGMPSARLFTRVREKEGLSYGAYARLRVPAIDRDASVVMSAIYNPGNVAKVRKVIAEEVEKMGREGVSEDEVARAKDGLLKQREMGRTQDASLAGMLAGGLHAGRTLEFEAQLEQKMRALTAEQVSAAARKYIEMGKVVVVTAGDFGGEKGRLPTNGHE